MEVEKGSAVAATGVSVEQMLPLVYEELRAIARRARRRLSAGETLHTTALVHEAYLRLVDNPGFADPDHFRRVAAVAMRRILVDRVRTQMAAKRGGGAETVTLEEVPDFVVENEKQVLGVHEALDRLAALNPRLAGIVECLFFAGYTAPETAGALGLSERTVRRDWAVARAWLSKELAA